MVVTWRAQEQILNRFDVGQHLDLNSLLLELIFQFVNERPLIRRPGTGVHRDDYGFFACACPVSRLSALTIASRRGPIPWVGE